MMGQMKSRLELPALIKPGGIGIELGVAAGYYSDVILKNSELKRLWSVDRWADHHGKDEFEEADEFIQTSGSKTTITKNWKNWHRDKHGVKIMNKPNASGS